MTSMLAGGLACSDDGVAAQAADDAGEGTDGPATTGGSAPTGAPTSSDGMTGPDEETSADSGEGASSGWDDTGEEGTGADGREGATECADDRDCVLVNDCCTCAAQHVDDEVPACEMACVTSKCDELGIAQIGATCRLGVCAFDKLSCDDSEVVCLALPPECPEGHLPEVDEGCWSGECVPDYACDVVPGCEHCTADEACVEIQTQLGPLYACEPIAPACDGEASCACMSEACAEPYDTCIDGDDGLQCACLAC